MPEYQNVEKVTTTLSIKAFNIPTLSIMKLSIMTLGIITLSITLSITIPA